MERIRSTAVIFRVYITRQERLSDASSSRRVVCVTFGQCPFVNETIHTHSHTRRSIKEFSRVHTTSIMAAR